jgi:hypothetical protein
MGWLDSPMALVWLAYFSIAELLSLLPSQPASCVLVSEEAGAENYSGDYACAAMHEAAFRFARFIWENAGHDNVVAFGSIAVSVFTYTLWRSNNRLWETGEKTAERQLRAYVSNPVAVEIKRFNTATPFIQLGFKNSGQTPAHNMRIWTSSAVSVYPLAHPPHLPDGGPISMGVIGPGADFHISIESDIPVTDDERQQVIAGDAAFYVYGHLAYDDAFGKPRETTFCVFYRSEVARSPSGKLATYHKWNKAS